MDHADIIRRLGGPTSLAKELGLGVVNTVGHWPARGIPSKYWHRIVAISQERGVAVTFADLERRNAA